MNDLKCIKYGFTMIDRDSNDLQNLFDYDDINAY